MESRFAKDIDNRVIDTNRFCGFAIGSDRYVISVEHIQELVRPLPITPVPLVPSFINGLINLRGQVVTSLNLSKLFSKGSAEEEGDADEYMNIIIRYDDYLYALKVDEILDVMNFAKEERRPTPENLDKDFIEFTNGIYRDEKGLITEINLDKLLSFSKDEVA